MSSVNCRLGHGFGETGFYRLTALDVLLKLNLAVSVHTQVFFLKNRFDRRFLEDFPSKLGRIEVISSIILSIFA